MLTDQLLGLLKLVLLIALYLFFARVLWAVWHEVRTPALQRAIINDVPVAQSPIEVHACSLGSSQTFAPPEVPSTTRSVRSQSTPPCAPP